MKLRLDEASSHAAFVTGPDGYDVVTVSRMTSANHGGDDNPEGIPASEIDAKMLTDDQWELVVRAVAKAVEKLDL
jgi:hypothetical protein